MNYTHLTENERYMMSALRKQGISVVNIAKELGRHRALSTDYLNVTLDALTLPISLLERNKELETG